MAEVVGTRKILVIQGKDGRFFLAGNDCPDSWVGSALQASERGWCTSLRDANLYGTVDGEIVEVEITARLTGRRQADLYSDGKLRADVDEPEDA